MLQRGLPAESTTVSIQPGVAPRSAISCCVQKHLRSQVAVFTPSRTCWMRRSPRPPSFSPPNVIFLSCIFICWTIQDTIAMSDAKGEDPPERCSFERVHVGDADGTSRPTAHIITVGCRFDWRL